MTQYRLNRFLARHGICSRRKADEWIQQGRVSVDGIVCRELGVEVDPDTQEIAVDGKILRTEPERYYIALNKPEGVVTTKSDPQARKTVMDFFPREIRESGIFPVGRLDSDSEGLLLLSNDGDWTQILLHPSHQVWKRYWVETEQPITPEIKKRFETGMILDGKRTLPAKVTTKGKNTTTQFEVEIREGKNRQIRRMCKKAGLEVKHLQRIVMGPIQLKALPVGQWRFLTQKEIQQVFALQAKQKDYS